MKQYLDFDINTGMLKHDLDRTVSNWGTVSALLMFMSKYSTELWFLSGYNTDILYSYYIANVNIHL